MTSDTMAEYGEAIPTVLVRPWKKFLYSVKITHRGSGRVLAQGLTLRNPRVRYDHQPRGSVHRLFRQERDKGRHN